MLENVPYSEWAAPVVAVPKRDWGVCLSGDYKVTVNPVRDVDQYPFLKPEQIFAMLSGGQHFTTLDLTHSYNQLLLDEASRNYVTINTHTRDCTSTLVFHLELPQPLLFSKEQWMLFSRELKVRHVTLTTSLLLGGYRLSIWSTLRSIETSPSAWNSSEAFQVPIAAVKCLFSWASH